MKIITEQFGVRSRRREQMIDITGEVNSIISQSGIREGEVLVYCPHTTAGITINENADPDVVSDILMMLSKLVPSNVSGYRHSEGNSDAHVKSTLVGVSEYVMIRGGKLVLGTWQALFFCEFDGPRSRRCLIRAAGS